MVKKAIKLIVVVQLLILSSYFISSTFYINLQIASLSSFLIIIGSFYAHKNMVTSQVLQKNYLETADSFDAIDDPYGLYDEKPLNDVQADDLDLKKIVKEEKAKIKTFSLKSIKEGGGAGVSFFRLIPYVFLVLAFMALKNNEILNISIYLPSLLVGIVLGTVVSKEVTT